MDNPEPNDSNSQLDDKVFQDKQGCTVKQKYSQKCLESIASKEKKQIVDKNETKQFIRKSINF